MEQCSTGCVLSSWNWVVCYSQIRSVTVTSIHYRTIPFNLLFFFVHLFDWSSLLPFVALNGGSIEMGGRKATIGNTLKVSR